MKWKEGFVLNPVICPEVLAAEGTLLPKDWDEVVKWQDRLSLSLQTAGTNTAGHHIWQAKYSANRPPRTGIYVFNSEQMKGKTDLDGIEPQYSVNRNKYCEIVYPTL